nr:Crp/Fnr family transcriptional regulator [uncultured Mucilaginibacter sp.]
MPSNLNQNNNATEIALQALLADVQAKVKLSATEADIFKACWTIKKLARNEFLFRNGEVCRYDSFVASGCLKAFYIEPETGKEVILFIAIDRWWTTDLESFDNQTPSIYNIQAVEESVLLQIRHAAFEELLLKVPALERYFRLILQRYAAAMQWRIITAYSLPAKERYLDFVKRYPSLLQKAPQYLIASYLGMSAEFLSKIRSEKKP